MPGFAWSNADIETLRRWRAMGYPCAAIAAALGRSTRSIIASVARLRAPLGRVEPGTVLPPLPGGRPPAPKPASAPKPVRGPLDPLARSDSAPVAPSTSFLKTVEPGGVEDPGKGCQWPTNHGRPRWLFCGCARADTDRPYCAAHAARASASASRAAA